MRGYYPETIAESVMLGGGESIGVLRKTMHVLTSRHVSNAGPAKQDARRIAKRRPTYLAQAGSYAIDAAILLLYAVCGVVGYGVPLALLAAGSATTLLWLLLSELGINDRFRDHYLTVPQAITSITIQLGAILLAPQVGVYFVFVLFIILGFGALRLTARQTGYVWTYAAVGLAALFTATDINVALPMTTWSDRALAVLGIVTVLARSASTGLYGSILRDALYRRTHQLNEARKRIEELAFLDELTGASNRRAVVRQLRDQITSVNRGHGPCSIALVDLDHFKRINDRFGHSAGDEVLKAFTISAFTNLPSSDSVGRYGGEEFLLIMPGTDRNQAIGKIERVRSIFGELDWSQLDPALRVTLSAGVCRLMEDDTAESALARVDAALYEAKESGRNRTIAA